MESRLRERTKEAGKGRERKDSGARRRSPKGWKQHRSPQDSRSRGGSLQRPNDPTIGQPTTPSPASQPDGTSLPVPGPPLSPPFHYNSK
jgi:hypothetical protein